jgi:hypothetical protein
VIGVLMPLIAAAIALAASQSSAAHAAHQPAHGGQVATAAGHTLHLEGAWPAVGRFRLFVSDSRGHALAPARLEELRARIVDGDRDVAPLVLSSDKHYFEAGVETKAPPMTVTVALARGAGRPEERVRFTFAALSVDEPPVFVLPPTVIPRTRAGIVALLRVEAREAGALLDGTSTRGAYVAIARVRDLALALDRYTPDLAAAARPRAESAIRAAVRAAWLLHVSLDEGMPFQTRMAANGLSEAIEELLTAFAVTTSPSGA